MNNNSKRPKKNLWAVVARSAAFILLFFFKDSVFGWFVAAKEGLYKITLWLLAVSTIIFLIRYFTWSPDDEEDEEDPYFSQEDEEEETSQSLVRRRFDTLTKTLENIPVGQALEGEELISSLDQEPDCGCKNCPGCSEKRKNFMLERFLTVN